jgi:hypothetical protein
MAQDLSDVYEAIRIAEKEGRAADVAALVKYLDTAAAAPAQETYDPREQKSLLYGAGAGAGAGIVGPALIKSGIASVKAGRVAPPPEMSVPHPSQMVSGVSAVDEAASKGLANEVSQQVRTSQRTMRTDAATDAMKALKAKGLPVNPNILAEMPTQVARPSGILLPVEAAKNIEAEEAARKALPKALPKDATYGQRAIAKMLPYGAKDIANFAKGVYDYKLPFVGGVGSLLGRGLAGAGAGMQGMDAYNRGVVQGDIPGAIISGIGGLGTAATLLPYAPAKVIGGGVGLSAEAINAYRDAMRRGQIVHGAPESYENTTPMGDQYAQGGLVYLANGGQPVRNPEDVNGTFSYAPGYYAEVADNIRDEGQTAGHNDALRHMLAAADISRRVNTPIRNYGLSSTKFAGIPLVSENVGPGVAKGLGWLHEMQNYIGNIGGKKPQTIEDMQQDLYNNNVGAQIGKSASSFQDIVNKMPEAIDVAPYRKEPGKAYIRNPNEINTTYKPFKIF